MTIPSLSLVATDDTSVMLSALPGRTVVFAYPRTGEPGKISLVDDWDMIPGARGCTPQTCAFRDLFAELKAAGAEHVFGLSTQSNEYQTEMASRLHLPFPVLVRREARADARARPADHAGGGADPDQADGVDHRQRPHHACFLPGLSARPECRRCAGLAKGKSGRSE